MENRINKLFREKPSGLLSLYFCAGHPAPHTTAHIIRTLTQRGIDMIEIGIPFSDPMADGPVIQNAASQALRGGMNLNLLFEELSDIRNHTDIPLILMGYLNPVIHYGFERFCQSCARCGIDGLILPDLPFADYIHTYKAIADRYGLRIIMLITPETSEERIRFIDNHTDGFIYMVSSAATTGAQHEFDADRQAYFSRIHKMGLSNPCMIGFGISNRQTLEAAQRNAAGAIIGSCFVELLDKHQDPEKALKELFENLKK
ncbi:MAG: tryptophan synthase subunit alpha [Clostridium sp.]|nr:tryptophan synthase subunit alpha [Clostridium sp.]